MTWALLQTLVNRGLRPQPFYAQGRFSARDAATTITGLPRRYLDSWLMKRGICIELFKHGSQFSTWRWWRARSMRHATMAAAAGASTAFAVTWTCRN